MKLEAVMQIGQALLPHTFAETSDPFVASDRLRRWAHLTPYAAPGLLEIVRDGLERPAKTMQLLWTARWAQCGFPQVTMGHRLAAALMATHVDSESSVHVSARWPAFLVVLPNELLHVPSSPRPWTVDYLTVFHTETFVDVVARGRGTDWMLGMHYRNFLAGIEALDDEHEASDWEEHQPGDTHRRLLRLLWRLVVAVEIETSGMQYVAIRNASARTTRASGPRRIRPITYALMRNVTVDCRDAIHAFVSGHAACSPTIRSLVRGHWKRQAYGAELSLRRWIHVEPYWRGPDGGLVSSDA